MKKLKYGIIGCGAVGKVHGYHFSHHDNIYCVASCDSDIERAKCFKEWFGFERAFTNYHEMLSTEGLDIVSECTPPALHPEQVFTASKAKCHQNYSEHLCIR